MKPSISLVCLALASALSAQPNWFGLTGTTAPQGRYGHALAYDQLHNEVVLFGGHNDQTFLGDTWVYSVVNGSWSQKAPAVAPPARRWHAMAYDFWRQRVVLFGGGNNTVVNYSDTWEWNGSSWSPIPLPGPAGRVSHAMTYDKNRGLVVLFGGMTGNAYQNDTWEYDGSSWKAKSLVAAPPGRAYSGLAHDIRRGKCVLFGGTATGSVTLGDTWEYDGSVWTVRITPTMPPVRYGHALEYDHARERTVLFGGRNTANLADTWEFDGLNWVQRATATKPMARYSARLAYTYGGFGTLLFGGSTFPGVLADTYRYNPTNPAIYQTIGTGCGTTAPQLAQSYDQAPYVGSDFTVLLSKLPVNRPASMILGASGAVAAGLPLPLSLTAIGMTGCTLYTSQEIVTDVVQNGTNGEWTVAIPNNPALVGAAFYNQALVFAPGQNALGVILSNAGKGTCRAL